MMSTLAATTGGGGGSAVPVAQAGQAAEAKPDAADDKKGAAGKPEKAAGVCADSLQLRS